MPRRRIPGVVIASSLVPLLSFGSPPPVSAQLPTRTPDPRPLVTSVQPARVVLTNDPDRPVEVTLSGTRLHLIMGLRIVQGEDGVVTDLTARFTSGSERTRGVRLSATTEAVTGRYRLQMRTSSGWEEVPLAIRVQGLAVEPSPLPVVVEPPRPVGPPVGPVEGVRVPTPGVQPPAPPDDAGADPGVNPVDRLPGAPLWGIADLHAHQFADRGFGGKVVWGSPFHPSGDVNRALPICVSQHGPLGKDDVMGTFLTLEASGRAHLPLGAPSFTVWPAWDMPTHQQMYVDLLERAVRGGLRLMVMRAVNSEAACMGPDANQDPGSVINPRTGWDCSDMPAIRRQVRAARELEAHVDQQAGGPGRGWYRIVETPAEARAAVEAGKLAVVLGTEVAALFGCQTAESCSRQAIVDGVRELRDLGVRDVTPVHQIDNAFGGAAVYNDIFSAAQFKMNGRPYDLEECSDGGYTFSMGAVTGAVGFKRELDEFTGKLFGTWDGWSQHDPPPAPHCNSRGLTTLGRLAIGELMAMKMMVDVDHMSRRTFDRVVELARTIPGGPYPLLSSHTGIQAVSQGQNNHEAQKSDAQIDALLGLGGLIAPILAQGGADGNGVRTARRTSGPTVPHDCGHSSKSFAQAYLHTVDRVRTRASGDELMAVALGSDFNGTVIQPAPRFGSSPCQGEALQPQRNPISYPVTVPGSDRALARATLGPRTYDINVDGLAHVGLLPDFIADLAAIGVPPADLQPLFNSAEAYIRMWERIEGTSVTNRFLRVRVARRGGSRAPTAVVNAYDFRTGARLAGTVTIESGDGRTLTGATGQPIPFTPCDQGEYDPEVGRIIAIPCSGTVRVAGYPDVVFQVN